MHLTRGPKNCVSWSKTTNVDVDFYLAVNLQLSLLTTISNMCCFFIQGVLGDCWFMSAMANLTLNKNLFAKVVPLDQVCVHLMFSHYRYIKDCSTSIRCSIIGQISNLITIAFYKKIVATVPSAFRYKKSKSSIFFLFINMKPWVYFCLHVLIFPSLDLFFLYGILYIVNSSFGTFTGIRLWVILMSFHF